jgi:hypothetical protein
MSLRLLSFLSLIQRRLEATTPAGGAHSAIRSVNYEQGLGRLLFREGGSITLHVPSGASSQGCIKATLTWPQSGARETRNFFPGTEGHDWTAAAEALALAWTAGPVPHATAEHAAPVAAVTERTSLRQEAVAV